MIRFAPIACGLALAFVAAAVVYVYVVGLPGRNDRADELAAGREQAARPGSEHVRAAMRTVMKAFLNASTLDERARYVRDPERVRPLMEDYYRRHPDGPIAFKGFAPPTMIRRQGNRDTGAVFVTWPVVMPDFSSRGLALEVTGPPDAPEYRVDWESFVVYSEMDWDDFTAAKPGKPVLFRVLASPGTYYNYDFRDHEKYICLKITDHLGAHTLHGYIPRDTPLAMRMKELFRTRKTIRGMVFRLKYPAAPRSDNQVEITELVDTQWVPGLGRSP